MKSRASLFLVAFIIFVASFISFMAFSSSAIGADNAYVADGYAKKAHEAFKDDDYPEAGELYERAYNTNSLPVYLENALTAYLHHAFDMLQDKSYNSAIKYCEKVLSLSPDNTEAVEILSDIYCSRGSGYYYRGKKDRARTDFERALEYSVLPEQKQKAQEMLALLGGSKSKIRGRSNEIDSVNLQDVPLKNFVNMNTLALMEARIYGQPNRSLSIEERVNRLEAAVFRRNFSGAALMARVENLQKVILPGVVSRND